MVLYRADLASRRQQLVDVASPAGWFITVAKAAGGRPIQHALNAATDALCRLRLNLPDRLNAFQHERRVDRVDGQLADDWIGVARERRAPLRPVLLIAPSGLVGLDVLICTFLERQPARGFDALSHPL